MNDKPFHSLRIEKNRVYLDNFMLKGIRKKALYLDGSYIPVLKLEIIFDASSKLVIDSSRDDGRCDLSEDV